MNDKENRWVLAFDASCATCRQISRAVATAAAERLEVLPLADADVRQWREQAFGPEAPWTPTLLRIQGTNVTAWTRAGMGLPLLRRLGLRATIRVLQSLGQLRRQAAGHPLERTDGNVIGRGRFLRIGAGAAIAAGMVFAGKTPAFAEQGRDAARAWVKAHKGNLPQTYDAIVKYPTAYRRAIFTELSSTAKSRLWVEHMSRYQTGRELSAAQTTVLDDAIRIAGDPATFDRTQRVDADLTGLKEAAIREFGKDEATNIFATLGPSDRFARPASAEPTQGGCTCNPADDWCAWGESCIESGCNDTVDGCGWWYNDPCTGLCYDT